MNKIKNFLSFVEISTKTASLIPFLAGTGYAIYQLGLLSLHKTIIFFIAMELFDMTATAINNHIGTRQQRIKNHYSTAVSLTIIFAMLTVAAVLGIYLTMLTSLAVLVTGILCFGIGILYSYGPLPIAATPFGEIFSGGVQGTLIPFLIYLIHEPDLFSIEFNAMRLNLSADVWNLLGILIAGLPLICCISNIMLANNICDLEEDVSVKRFTLPYYIGKGYSLKLFQILYIAAFIFLAVGILIGFLPVTALLGMTGIVLVFKNTNIFLNQQSKKKTFHLAIINFLLISVPYTLGIWLVQIKIG